MRNLVLGGMVVGLLCSLAAAEQITINVTETNCGSSCSGTLDVTEVLYCTGTANCTPNRYLPGSRRQSDNGNGGDALQIITQVPMVAGETHACVAAYHVATNQNRSALSTTKCCTGGTCS